MAKARKKEEGAEKLLFTMDQPGGTPEEMGGKGFGLWRMRGLGLSVPPACALSSSLCRRYWEDKRGAEELLRKALLPEIRESLTEEGVFPLVSVRSGAKVSMPGMMDTILNVGLTRDSLPFWEKRLGTRAARDSRRRLLQMFGDVVFGIGKEEFEERIGKAKRKRGVSEDRDLDETDLLGLCSEFEGLIAKRGHAMPETAEEQLALAALAVWDSWNGERAKEYRRMEGIPDDMGTAVVVQRMVFGNLNDRSASGVMFSRDPSTGRNTVVGEFLANAQGEDVVAGSRTPESLLELEAWSKGAYEELRAAAKRLEAEERDMQDIEFTIEDGKVWLLQTRRAKRSAVAAAKCALEMEAEGLIGKGEALERIGLEQYERLRSPMVAPGFSQRPDAEGLAGSVGIVTAPVRFSSREAAENPGCVLVSMETTPEDLPGMRAAAGILTATGGVTSHAAVVARGMDKVCVVGAGPMEFIRGPKGKIEKVMLGDKELLPGDLVTLDGASGRVWAGGGVPVIPGGGSKELLDLHDLAADHIGAHRIATDGRDLHSDRKMVYATYALDGLEERQIREEIRESLPYLNGILDLSMGTEYAKEADREVSELMGGSADEAIFEAKAEAALSYGGEKDQILAHLGAREKEWRERFERAGYRVIKKGSAADLGKEGYFCVCESEKDRMAAVEAAKRGELRAVAAVAAAPRELLMGEDAPGKGNLALSAEQMLGSALRRRM